MTATVVASSSTTPISTSMIGGIAIALCSTHLVIVIFPNPPFPHQFPICVNFVILAYWYYLPKSLEVLLIYALNMRFI